MKSQRKPEALVKRVVKELQDLEGRSRKVLDLFSELGVALGKGRSGVPRPLGKDLEMEVQIGAVILLVLELGEALGIDRSEALGVASSRKAKSGRRPRT
jgi:hypothetical protein